MFQPATKRARAFSSQASFQAMPSPGPRAVIMPSIGRTGSAREFSKTGGNDDGLTGASN